MLIDNTAITVPYPFHLLDAPAGELVGWAVETFGSALCVCTSFQDEGMVLLDLAARLDPSVRVITLDTGRLPEETHRMIEQVRQRYSVRVEMVAPDPAEVETMTVLHGPNLFHDSIAKRRLCCHIRKVRPLDRKLAGFQAVAYGLRRSQSDTRADIARIEEEGGGRLRIHPLADWTAAQVREYLERHDVPRHPLYAQGYTSIGCAPCTRAVEPGEHERAGRWWWELDADKECGLHQTPEGQLRRELDVLLDEVLAASAVSIHQLN